MSTPDVGEGRMKPEEKWHAGGFLIVKKGDKRTARLDASDTVCDLLNSLEEERDRIHQQYEDLKATYERVSGLWNEARTNKPRETSEWSAAVAGVKEERDRYKEALESILKQKDRQVYGGMTSWSQECHAMERIASAALTPSEPLRSREGEMG